MLEVDDVAAPLLKSFNQELFDIYLEDIQNTEEYYEKEGLLKSF